METGTGEGKTGPRVKWAQIIFLREERARNDEQTLFIRRTHGRTQRCITEALMSAHRNVIMCCCHRVARVVHVHNL